MIRPLYIAALCSLGTQTWANPWICILATHDTSSVYGVHSGPFALNLYPHGRFSAQSHPRMIDAADWRWSGTWTEVEDQIALIGDAQLAWHDPILRGPTAQFPEVQGYSEIYQDNLIVLHMTKDRRRSAVVQCTREMT